MPEEFEDELPPPFWDSFEEYDMPGKIDYRAWNDHDLLVMAVMQGNDLVQQQEKIILHLAELNGTVKTTHTWVCALRWVIGGLIIILCAVLGSVTKTIGVW